MELIKTNSSDAFTVSVGENIPGQFVFIDATAIPRQPYYYGVIAAGLSDEGKWLKSKMSNVVVGRGYDLTPPEPRYGMKKIQDGYMLMTMTLFMSGMMIFQPL